MRFELFVAFRYLRAHRKQAVVSVVTLVSVLGVMAGVLALNIALALNTGLQREFQSRILGATSHVNLLRIETKAIPDFRQLLSQFDSIPEVTRVTPTVYGQALLSSDLREHPAVLKGVEAGQSEDSLAGLTPKLIEGSLERFHQQAPLPAIVLGKDLAQTLGVSVGERIRAVGSTGELTPFGRALRRRAFEVVAIFESGLWQYDANWGLVPLAAAQSFFSLGPSEISAVEFRINDIYAAGEIAERIREAAGDGFVTNTWIELNRPLFSALELEKLALFIAISLIVLVASLNIVSTLTLMVMEKGRDIAIITAMGGTSRTVMVIFILQGLIIGVAGTLLGGLLACLAVWYFDTYQVFRLEPEVYSIPYVPFELGIPDVVLVSCVAVLISFLATLYPARAAARLDPVKALRYE